MLSPSEANRMMGERMARRSKVFPLDHSAPPAASLLPTNRLSTIHLISSRFIRKKPPPPALEFQKALGLCVDLGKEVVVLLEKRVRRVQGLEILDQVGPVELPTAKITGQQRRPDPAEHAAGVAHRVLGIVAGPIRHGRAVHDKRANTLGIQ